MLICVIFELLPIFLWNYFKKPTDCFKLFNNNCTFYYSYIFIEEKKIFSVFQMQYQSKKLKDSEVTNEIQEEALDSNISLNTSIKE